MVVLSWSFKGNPINPKKDRGLPQVPGRNGFANKGTFGVSVLKWHF